jgi:hypothetical protein
LPIDSAFVATGPMTSIGGVSSFWQQDQAYWSQAHGQDQTTSAENALINVMSNAMVNLSKGLSGIANGTALKRVNSTLVSDVESLLQPSGSSTTSSGASTASSASAASSASGSATSSSSAPTPAIGIGTARLTTGTSLSSLGILANEDIQVSAGTHTTTYTSTGSDTVGDLINAINVDLPTNANVTASLNAKGQLVITSRDTTDTITIGGTATAPASVGFGVGNTAFAPTTPSASASGTSSASSSSNSSTGSASGQSSSSTASSTSGSSKTASTSTSAALAQQGFATAASILSANGVSGTLVDMLA